MKKIGAGILNGFFWTTGGHALTTLINLVTNIVLARLLEPKDFGIIGITLFFTTIANVLVKGGLGGALVRLKDLSDNHLKTVFTFNLLVSTSLYFALVLFSTTISNFYEQPRLGNVLIVSGLILFINAFQLVNTTLLIRDMRFKRLNIYQSISVFLSSICGITLAFKNFGIWSLVALQLGNQLFVTLQLIFFEKFYIKFGWDKSSFLEIYKFGLNTTLSNLLKTAFNNIYQLVLGKYFSISQVGYFYQAKKMEQVPNNAVNIFTQNVLYSGLSKLKEDLSKFTAMYNKFVRTLTALSGFITIFIFVYGEYIILLLFGDKWIDATFYLQILIVASFFYMQENYNRVIFKVFDKTELILFLEIFKKSIHALTILIGVYYKDIVYLLLGLIITNILSFSLNYYYSRKIIKDYTEIVSILKVICCCAFNVALYKFYILHLPLEGVYLLFTIPFFLLIYLITIHLFKILDVKKDSLLLFQTLKSDRLQ